MLALEVSDGLSTTCKTNACSTQMIKVKREAHRTNRPPQSQDVARWYHSSIVWAPRPICSKVASMDLADQFWQTDARKKVAHALTTQ